VWQWVNGTGGVLPGILYEESHDMFKAMCRVLYIQQYERQKKKKTLCTTEEYNDGTDPEPCRTVVIQSYM
jgi:hypothetical protein